MTDTKKAVAMDAARWGMNLDQLDEMDAWSSEWKDCKENGEVWGGRSRGGRGIRVNTGFSKDIHVEGITLQFVGKTLLNSTDLILVHGHKYGLVGYNGVGKSTLLRRFARYSIPGVPTHLKIVYMQQEIPEVANKTVLQFLREGGSTKNSSARIAELESLELKLNDDLENASTTSAIESIAEQLCTITEEIEKLQTPIESSTDGNEDFVATHKVILEGLGLVKKSGKSNYLDKQLSELSGGWRVRAALASMLIEASSADVLLLDEPSNHLDIKTVRWLGRYLSETMNHLILVLVSHDRYVLEAVCTDIIEMKEQQLHYYHGSYESWLDNISEMKSFHENRHDAELRRADQIKKSDTSNSQIKKKLERNAMHKGIDGKKFKNFSLKKLTADAVHLADKETFVARQPQEAQASNHFKLPTPDLVTLRLASPSAPLLSMDHCSIRWLNKSPSTSTDIDAKLKPTLSEVSLDLCAGTNIAIVGLNGQGKSTLMAAILACSDNITSDGMPAPSSIDALDSAKASQMKSKSTTKASSHTDADLSLLSADSSLEIRGKTVAHRNLKIGHLSQHHIDVMSSKLELNPIQYIQTLAYGKSLSDLEVRSHIGRFGISGQIALNPIASLSGGQKARLALASACLRSPHILLLDEPTNHLSMDAIEALAAAVRSFEGTAIIISHNEWFLNATCDQLMLVRNGKVESVRTPITATPAATATGSSSHGGSKKQVAIVARPTTAESYTFSELLDSYIDSQSG